MKIRFGFVTNSSSSSFIIGKVGEKSITLDDVFSIIKDAYKEWINKSQEYFDYVKEMHKKNKKYPDVKDYHLVFDKNDSFEKKCAIRDELDKKLGISHYDLYDGRNLDFLQCATYEDYQKYAQKKIDEAQAAGQRTYGLVPFTIEYLTNPNPVLLHNGVYEEEDDGESYVFGEILSWYCPKSYEKGIVPSEDYCNHCSDREWCGGAEARDVISKNTELDPVERLGQVCVYSECGYIADYVVEQLGNIAHLWCNHMG